MAKDDRLPGEVWRGSDENGEIAVIRGADPLWNVMLRDSNADDWEESDNDSDFADALLVALDAALDVVTAARAVVSVADASGGVDAAAPVAQDVAVLRAALARFDGAAS